MPGIRDALQVLDGRDAPLVSAVPGVGIPVQNAAADSMWRWIVLPEQITAGARTVTHIAEHFAELKQQALGMLETFGASQRGFFTPTEDEEVRHLQVSYWQARNALVELVVSFHNDTDLPEELRPAGFLVAYSGALVLIDAARFLRKHFHDREVVCSKLNEPAPHFGIPEGTYDRIQKSLTSPVHAWHLYHAARYFSEHRQQLDELAGHETLAGLLEIVDRLEEQIQISVGRYALVRARVRAHELMSVVKRDLLSKALYGLQKAVSRLVSDIYTLTGHDPKLPAHVQQELRGLLEPGDVLITRKEGALTNYFLPGFWPHAALFLGGEKQFRELGLNDHEHVKPRWARFLACDSQEPLRVLEALKDGVFIRSLASPFGSDALLVLRPQLDQSRVGEALARGLFHDGKPYDFDFDFTRADRLVCTEVVYRSFEGIGGIRFRLTRRAGRLTLAAEDLVQMALNREHFEPVAVFAPNHASTLLRGNESEAVIRKTHVPPPKPSSGT